MLREGLNRLPIKPDRVGAAEFDRWEASTARTKSRPDAGRLVDESQSICNSSDNRGSARLSAISAAPLKSCRRL